MTTNAKDGVATVLVGTLVVLYLAYLALDGIPFADPHVTDPWEPQDGHAWWRVCDVDEERAA